MNNKKRQIIIICAIILIIISSLAPGINAGKIQISIENFNGEQASLGSIYGHTGISYIWGFSPVRFAKVEAGDKTTISGPFMGEYKIRGLPLGNYTVTGSKKGYITYTTTVTLTEDRPDKQAFIDLQPTETTSTEKNEYSDILFFNNEKIDPFKSLKFGLIYGNTVWAVNWSGGPLKFTSIVAIGEKYHRTKLSGFLGFYFLIVPLYNQINITASKIGYETETKSLTLTEKNRFKYVRFTLNEL